MNSFSNISALVKKFDASLRMKTKGGRPASDRDHYQTLAKMVWENVVHHWANTEDRYFRLDPKKVYYLSLEFYMGRSLSNTILNIDLQDIVTKTLYELGLEIEDLQDHEADAGLGNGGLGRLAACFLDSMATLGLPAYGYGIRYNFGIFQQKIVDGWQKEVADNWLRFGNMWEEHHLEMSYPVYFYGRTNVLENGRREWVDTVAIKAVPYDTPVPGYKNDTCNTMRLWSAKAEDSVNFSFFNNGHFEEAVHEAGNVENICHFLYPNDNHPRGKELRLKQQYFFIAASLQDIIARYKHIEGPLRRETFEEFPDKVAIQLNDTHPSMAIPELMRILVDEEELDWDASWNICVKTFAYTNHTVLPEALERWSVSLIENLLPRHLEIIYEINRRFLDLVGQKWPNDIDRIRRMSLVEDYGEKKINMANLAIVGSHTVNGVAAIHSQIIKDETFKDFYELWPDKFQNKTNGVTPRRWLLLCNPLLSELITDKICDGWVRNLSDLSLLGTMVDDEKFLQKIVDIKHRNKVEFARYIKKKLNEDIDPCTMFDVQVKRIHEYKRQLLKCLHIIVLYNRIKKNPDSEVVPRTVIIGGKAAPGYHMAKLIIKLFTSIGQVINNDSDVCKKLKVLFLENYGVSMAEKVFPASDLSEQISTAGTEASGTGNMKFMMNGALTIGTMDGANVEMCEEAGRENMFIFGMTVAEVNDLKSTYNPQTFIRNNEELTQCLNQIRDGHFSPDQTNLFHEVYNSLAYNDKYMLCADFEDYVRAQDEADEVYKDQMLWAKKVLNNIASSGKFSSDRTISQYAKEIWQVDPCLEK